MSCAYGYLCRDCKVSVTYGNRAEKHLKDMFTVEREANAPLDATLKLSFWCFNFVSERYGQASIEECFYFLQAHRGHDLVIGNEYNHEIEYFVLTHPKEGA